MLSHSVSQGPRGPLGQRAGWHKTKRDVVSEKREAAFMSNYAPTSLILGTYIFLDVLQTFFLCLCGYFDCIFLKTITPLVHLKQQTHSSVMH